MERMTAADFAPDADGLLHALRILIDERSQIGSPLPTPAGPPESWPQTGIGQLAALDLLTQSALTNTARLDHPGFFAHMDPPTPWVTWATAMWAASTNQNLLHSQTAPSARPLEKAVIQWLAPRFGMDGGQLVPGSTIANLTALWAARELRGIRRVFCSISAHVSVRKAAGILGLELCEIPTNDSQQLRLDVLPDKLDDAALVLTAGTTATGAIDPLQADLGAGWVHADAAWAGPLRLSSHAHLLDGLERCDSIAVSAHKWLYQPKDSAMVLWRESDEAEDALSFGASYLSDANVGLLGSHANAALPLAATLLAWGREGVRERIDSSMSIASRLAEIVAADALFELYAPPITGVVNWRPIGCDPAMVGQRLEGAWVSLTVVDGEVWFRSVSINPNADPELVVAAMRQALAD